MKRVTQVLYGLVAAGALAAGVIGVMAPGMIVPEVAASPLTAHLAREEGAAFVFIGLMAIWCLRHFDQRRPVHYAFVVFTALFAAIHWEGYLRSGEYLRGAVVNTVPFIAFAVTAPRKAAI